MTPRQRLALALVAVCVLVGLSPLLDPLVLALVLGIGAVSIADEMTRRMTVAGLVFDSMTVTPDRIAVHVPKAIFDDTCAAIFRGGERTYMSHLDGSLRDWWDCNGLVCAMRVHVQAEGEAR